MASTGCGTTIFTIRRWWHYFGHNEAYYTDYLGKPQEFISAAKHGYLYQGQRYEWQRKGAVAALRRLATGDLH